VTTTILDIIARFTRGGISTAGVPANLPSVPGFTVIHERPSTVLRRITNKLGGGFYLDANRVLRAWSSTIPSPLQEPAPVPLTDHLSTLHTFRMTEDASQQRTRVFVEGQRTSTLLAVQEGIDWQTQYLAVALQEGGIFPVPGEQLGQIDYMRIDNQFSDVPQGVSNPALDGSSNPPGTVLTEDAPIGTGYIMVADATAFPLSGVAQAAGQLVFYIKGAETVLNLYITTGFPGVRAPITAGTQIIAIPYVTFHPVDRSPTPGILFEKALTRLQPQGAAAVTLASMEDAGIAATIGAREGSDGFYEHLVQDGRLNQAGCRARAQAELADFSQPLLTYEWETDDLNAQPGRMQHIALTEGTPITADVRITNVTVTPLVSGRPPRRQVKATKVQTAGVVDVWVDDTR
jgi:hypothetical protein